MAVDATPIGSFTWQTSHLLSFIVICVSHTRIEFHKFVDPQECLGHLDTMSLHNRYLTHLTLIIKHLNVEDDLWSRHSIETAVVDEKGLRFYCGQFRQWQRRHG